MSSNPNQWLGLLRWSIAHTDGTSPSQFSHMTDEDRQFLESVFASMTHDEPTRLNEILTKFKDVIETQVFDEDELENLLEEMRDIVEQIDMAQVLVKFGGITVIFALLQLENLSIDVKSLAVSSIATITQNNIIVQDILYQQKLLPKLVDLYLQSSGNYAAKVRSL